MFISEDNWLTFLRQLDSDCVLHDQFFFNCLEHFGKLNIFAIVGGANLIDKDWQGRSQIVDQSALFKCAKKTQLEHHTDRVPDFTTLPEHEQGRMLSRAQAISVIINLLKGAHTGFSIDKYIQTMDDYGLWDVQLQAGAEEDAEAFPFILSYIIFIFSLNTIIRFRLLLCCELSRSCTTLDPQGVVTIAVPLGIVLDSVPEVDLGDKTGKGDWCVLVAVQNALSVETIRRIIKVKIVPSGTPTHMMPSVHVTIVGPVCMASSNFEVHVLAANSRCAAGIADIQVTDLTNVPNRVTNRPPTIQLVRAKSADEIEGRGAKKKRLR
ncbi:hypothetical protein niasHT_002903 [Heterodera trifolii]|uniref:Uncharacterized protein n=1 Tax=Heterodera trifolii TaxID=157864 RepID=A0ABD2LP97_9BILA